MHYISTIHLRFPAVACCCSSSPSCWCSLASALLLVP
jgi:hypothetical protein